MSKDLIVRNVGHDATTVSGTSLTGSSGISIINNGCTHAHLVPGGACAITVRYDPRGGSGAAHLTVGVDHGHGGESMLAGTATRDAVVVRVDLSQGTVTSMDGQGCSGPADCVLFFPLDTAAITLTETPDAGSSFDGWSGECAGSSQATCTFAVPPDPTTLPIVVATFKTN